jgi:hypothetical protein
LFAQVFRPDTREAPAPSVRPPRRVIWGEFMSLGAVCFGSPSGPVASFSNHIRVVIGGRSQEQVRGVYAWRIVAAVADEHSFGYGAVMQLPRQSVHTELRAGLASQVSVTIVMARRQPVHLCPKPFLNRRTGLWRASPLSPIPGVVRSPLVVRHAVVVRSRSGPIAEHTLPHTIALPRDVKRIQRTGLRADRTHSQIHAPNLTLCNTKCGTICQ